MEELCTFTWQEYLTHISLITAIPPCSYSDTNFTGIGMKFCLMMLQILNSLNTLNVRENYLLKNTKPLYHKLRFE